MTLNWTFAWFSYVEEQQEHNQPLKVGGYFSDTMRDTMENWQSEFLQLMWQVGGLSVLLYVGSPQSKEAEERLESKVDLVIKSIRENQEVLRKQLEEIEEKYPKK